MQSTTEQIAKVVTDHQPSFNMVGVVIGVVVSGLGYCVKIIGALIYRKYVKWTCKIEKIEKDIEVNKAEIKGRFDVIDAEQEIIKEMLHDVRTEFHSIERRKRK